MNMDELIATLTHVRDFLRTEPLDFDGVFTQDSDFDTSGTIVVRIELRGLERPQVIEDSKKLMRRFGDMKIPSCTTRAGHKGFYIHINLGE
jgi:hypothetical protein